MAEQDTSNKESAQEPAEGSRETVSANLGETAADDHYDTTRAQRGTQDKDASGGGITNRPLGEEIENQRELPRRGTAKNPDEDHA